MGAARHIAPHPGQDAGRGAALGYQRDEQQSTPAPGRYSGIHPFGSVTGEFGRPLWGELLYVFAPQAAKLLVRAA